MYKKKILTPLRVAVAVSSALALLTLTGCGDDDDNTSEVDLVSKFVTNMTPENKSALMHGFMVSPTKFQGAVGYIPSIDVANAGTIPTLRLTDGPAGMRNSKHQSTAMPAPLAIASTFDPDLAYRLGAAVGRETRATYADPKTGTRYLGNDILLAPMVNTIRMPHAGRNFETYGEDPLLQSKMVVENIKGIQSEGAMATVKHFALNEQETRRGEFSESTIDERTMREIYLPPFEAAIRDAKVAAVMCSYNRINLTDGPAANQPANGCDHPYLLNTILREQWGFEGFVMTDWVAGEKNPVGFEDEHSPSPILNGLDMEMPFGIRFGDNLVEAQKNGWDDPQGDSQASPEDATRYTNAATLSATRILTQLDRFGLLDGSSKTRLNLEDLKDDNAELAEEAALKGFVLLKNENSTLPLKENEKILVVGHTAKVPNVGGGGSSLVRAWSHKSTWDALEELKPSGVELVYKDGINLDGELLEQDANNGRGGISNLRQCTKDDQDCAGASQYPDINYVRDSGNGELTLDAEVKWTANITPPSVLNYGDKGEDLQLRIQVSNGSGYLKLECPSKVTGSMVEVGSVNMASVFDTNNSLMVTKDSGLQNSVVTWTPYDPLSRFESTGCRIEVKATGGKLGILAPNVIDPDQGMQVRLNWSTPKMRQNDLDDAITEAQKVDGSGNPIYKKVLVFAHSEGTEGSDRGVDSETMEVADNSLALPFDQDELIAGIAAVNDNTVAVLSAPAPVTMPWVDDTSAIFMTWIIGQEGANASAKLLYGLENPSGHSAVTFPAQVSDTPAGDPSDANDGINNDQFPGIDQGKDETAPVLYSEGLFVGYRHYDQNNIKPLFPFGHGLSYTNFTLGAPSTTKVGNGYQVTFTVTNSGAMKGDAVPQVYVTAPTSVTGLEFAPKSLVGFKRVSLNPGESQTVTVDVSERALSYWDLGSNSWKLPSEERTFKVCESADDNTCQ